MRASCPSIKTDREFATLVDHLRAESGTSEGAKISEDLAMKAAYRMWAYHEALSPGNGSREALKAFGRSTEEKQALLNKAVKNIRPPKEGEEHVYRWLGDEKTELRALSKEIDNQTENFYETSTKSVTSESGTNIHALLSEIVKGDATEANENIKMLAKDKNIPEATIKDLVTLKDKFKEMGDVVSEQTVYSAGSEEGVDIAGLSDIIIYAPDGKKYIVDLKTVYRTETVRKAIAKGEKKSAWNPLANDAQKAKRYTIQTLGYGRMTEFADRQAATDHFIVPIEVELNDDNDLTKGYKSIEVLPMESVNDWGYVDYASGVLDKIFNVSSDYNPTTVGVLGKDDSSQVYVNLTGDFGSGMNYTEMAKRVPRQVRRGLHGYMADDKFVPFQSTDPKEQLSEIERDYIRNRGRITHDISHGVKNFLMTGDDKYISSIGDRKKNLVKLLKPYIGRVGTGKDTDVKVVNLSEVKGYEDKKNWVMIEEGTTRHLYYISADNMAQTFATNKFMLSSSSSLFASRNLKAGVDGVYAKNVLNSSLRNTIGDARAFEGTLIAIKLKEANPEINFGTTLVHGISGSGYSTFIDLKENLETLKNIMKEPSGKVRKALFDKQDDFLALLGKEGTLDYNNYRTDFLSLLETYMEYRSPDPGTDKRWVQLTGMLLDSAKNEFQHKKILEQVSEYINKRVALGRNAEVDYETYLLSAYYLQSQKMDISLLPSALYRTWGGLPSNITQPMQQSLFKKLNVAINNMNRSFWSNYKDEFTAALTTFLKSKGIVNTIGDMATGDTQRHYKELFLPLQGKYIRNEDGTESLYEGPSFNLKQEGTPEFNALSPEAQALIRTMNNLIMKFTADNDIPWRKGNFPLATATAINKFRNAKRTGGGAYAQLIDNMLRDLDANLGMGDNTEPSDHNIFMAQRDDGISDNREPMMGFQGKYLNTSEFNKWSTDVEHVMDVFAIQGLKHKVFNEISTSLRAVHSIFQWYSSNLLMDRLGLNIDWVNHTKTVNLDNRAIDSGTTADKGARLVNRFAALGMYALNPLSAATAYVGNELTLMSQTLGNTLSKSKVGPGIGNYMKAKAILGPVFAGKVVTELSTAQFDTVKKVDALMRKFRMFNGDLSSMLNGYHKAGDKFIFRSKYLYSMLNAGDYIARANLMVAQMLSDGTWDAYSVNENGDLKYDPSKDERWGAGSKYTPAEQAALKSVLPTDDGYDDNMGDSLRNTANYLLGTNDREDRAIMNFTWWGKLFLASKGWLTAKADRWFLGIGDNRVGQSEVIGRWDFQKDADGNTHAFWKGDHMEGIIMSLLAGYHFLRTSADQRTPLTDIQKNNITRFIGDIALLTAAGLLASAIPDDDDETTADDWLANVLRWGSDDLLTAYTLAKDPSFVWEPTSVAWFAKVTQNSLAAGFQQDPAKLIKITPVLNELNRWSQVMLNEDFEIDKGK